MDKLLNPLNDFSCTIYSSTMSLDRKLQSIVDAMLAAINHGNYEMQMRMLILFGILAIWLTLNTIWLCKLNRRVKC